MTFLLRSLLAFMAFLLSLLGLVLAVHAYDDYSKPLAVQLFDSEPCMNESAANFLRAEIESGLVLTQPNRCKLAGFLCPELPEEALFDKSFKKPLFYLRSPTQRTLEKDLDLVNPSKIPKVPDYPNWFEWPADLTSQKELDLKSPNKISFDFSSGKGPQYPNWFEWPADLTSQNEPDIKSPNKVSFAFTSKKGLQYPNWFEWPANPTPRKEPGLTSSNKGPSDLAISLQKPMMHSGKFFRLGFLKVGTYFGLPPLDNKISNKFLHPALYDVLPFAENKLPQLLVSFGLRQDSKFGNVMKSTLQGCNKKNIPSSIEIRKCAISTQEVMEIASMLLHDEIIACKAKSNSDCNLKSLALSTSHNSYEMVKIIDVQLIANSTVACHPLPFPYTVYGCHKIYETKLFQVIMQGSREKIISPVLCHMKTEAFRSSHPAFKALNTTPGDGEICHWVYSRAMGVYV